MGARLTPEQVLQVAAETAKRLNLPWNPASVVAKPPVRIWLFPRRWRVTSRVPEELAETILFVDERTGRGFPLRVRHRRPFGVKQGN